MIASFLLCYCLLLLISLNSNERVRRTTLGMIEKVEWADCKGKGMKTKRNRRGGAEEEEEGKIEDQREDGQRMRGDG